MREKDIPSHNILLDAYKWAIAHGYGTGDFFNPDSKSFHDPSEKMEIADLTAKLKERDTEIDKISFELKCSTADKLTRIMELDCCKAKLQERDKEIELLNAKVRVYKDSQLRTYDGMTTKFDKINDLLAKAREVLSYYASPDVYTPFVTFGGERQPGVLTEQGRKARAFLKELEGM